MTSFRARASWAPGSRAHLRSRATDRSLPWRRDGLVALEERERVAFGIGAAGEPADRRDRLLVLRLPAQLTHSGNGLLDVTSAEVDDRSLLAILRGEDRPAGLVPVEHVVLDRPAPLVELPAEERRPECLRAPAVLSRKLEVHKLTFHHASLSR